jgi:hypothetical protein
LWVNAKKYKMIIFCSVMKVLYKATLKIKIKLDPAKLIILKSKQNKNQKNLHKLTKIRTRIFQNKNQEKMIV